MSDSSPTKDIILIDNNRYYYYYDDDNNNSTYDDDYDDDDGGFDGYIPTSKDPGPAVLILTIVLCVGTLVAVPFVITLLKRLDRWRGKNIIHMEWKDDKVEEDEEEEDDDDEEEQEREQKQEQELNYDEWGGKKKTVTVDVLNQSHHSYNTSKSHHSYNTSKSHHSYNTSKSRTSNNTSRSKVKFVATNDAIEVPHTPPTVPHTSSSESVNQQPAFLSNIIHNISSPAPSVHSAKSKRSGTSSRSKRSNATNRSAWSTASSANTSVLDAGVGRRGRAGGRGRRRMDVSDQKARRLRARMDEEEEREEMKMEGTLGGGERMGGGGSIGNRSNHRMESQLTIQHNNISSASGQKRMIHKEGSFRSSMSHVSHVSHVSHQPSVMSRMPDDTLSPCDAVDADDPGIIPPVAYGKGANKMDEDVVEMPDDDFELDLCWGPNAWYRFSVWERAFDNLVLLSEFDAEGKRILRLALPFAFSAIVGSVSSAIVTAVISIELGVEALVASSVVDLALGITNEFLMGVVYSASTLYSHAYGAENYKLVGQYIQICSIIYVIVSLPVIVFWSFYVKQLLLWFQFSEDVANLGQTYARITIYDSVIYGLDYAYSAMLEVTGNEIYMTVLEVIGSFTYAGMMAVAVIVFDADLIDLAYMSLVNTILYYFFNIWFTLWKGWAQPYKEGFLGSFAMKNRAAVYQVIRTSIPLSIGSLLSYGEWELLTLMAAQLGPAEVASWALLETIWDLFETTTAGIGDAAEVRCAFHLGKGNYALARTSSYKSILLGSVVAIFVTAIFFIMGEDIPGWFTKDVTLQNMLNELIPLIGIGNVTMTYGMVAWSLVGAQGRYRLGTVVIFFTSWFITMPMAGIMTYVLDWNLKGIASAVVVGYSFAALILTVILMRSDWEKLSKIIQEVNEAESESDSDSEGDEDEDEEESHFKGEDSVDGSRIGSHSAPPPRTF